VCLRGRIAWPVFLEPTDVQTTEMTATARPRVYQLPAHDSHRADGSGGIIALAPTTSMRKRQRPEVRVGPEFDGGSHPAPQVIENAREFCLLRVSQICDPQNTFEAAFRRQADVPREPASAGGGVTLNCASTRSQPPTASGLADGRSKDESTASMAKGRSFGASSPRASRSVSILITGEGVCRGDL
jgi:hypothetical protein